jgi:uncharacterized protein involved in tellurium resistance
MPKARVGAAPISFDRPGRQRERPELAPPAAAPPPVPPAVPRPPVPRVSAQPPSVRPAGSASLDLEPSARQPATAPPAPTTRAWMDIRVSASTRLVLTPAAPTVTLTRMQSGIGALRFEAACSAEVGDLRIGCAYQLASGLSSTVQRAGGNRFAPPDSRRPVLVAGHERYEHVDVDLRQAGELRRLVVYAFSESRGQLRWGGILAAETPGHARVEVPLDSLQGGTVAVLMSLYNIRGEFVLRAEMETLYGGVREACRAYGFDRISWLDDRTAVG